MAGKPYAAMADLVRERAPDRRSSWATARRPTGCSQRGSACRSPSSTPGSRRRTTESSSSDPDLEADNLAGRGGPGARLVATVGVVNQLDGLRRYIEAATTLTQITRGRAEEIVRDLVASGELERNRAQDWIEDLVKRSREASETLVATVSSEVDRQLGDRGLKNLDLDDLAQRVAEIIEMAGTVGRTVTSPRSRNRGGDGDRWRNVRPRSRLFSPRRSAEVRSKTSSGKSVCEEEGRGEGGPGSNKDRLEEGCDKSAAPRRPDPKKVAATGTDRTRAGPPPELGGIATPARSGAGRTATGGEPQRGTGVGRGGKSARVRGRRGQGSRLVARAEPVVVMEPRRFVSRGGEKLDAALERFAVTVKGRTCLDAGASTGGFTDCLLKRGASRVWAVDVGHGQLAPEMRADQRVVVVERCNLRHATLESLEREPFEVVVADLSFISLSRRGSEARYRARVAGRGSGPAREASIRSRPRRGGPWSRGDPGPSGYGATPHPGRNRVRVAGRGHHGGHGITRSRACGKRRVPPSRPCSD